jgi:glycerophosphoryl diester phosphodiesterase
VITLKRTFLAAVSLMAIVTLLPGSAVAAPDRPATPPPTDFWKNMGFINMAHQGGERENPGNTLFAFKKAVADGADVIDMDITLTEDGVLVATHDSQPCHTSNAPCSDGSDSVTFRSLTLNELRQFDFAYWFSPGLATYYDKNDPVPHPYRGMADGNPSPPAGYSASDFKIATFDQVLDAFPDTPINVELKPYTDPTETAEAAAAVLADHPGREADVIINSFSQAMIEAFHTAAPNHLALGGSLEGTLSYVTGNPITPTPVAVQPPDRYNLGGNVVDTLPLLRPFFEYDGFISVVWPSDLDETQETDPWYAKLISQGADAINTMFPSRLHQYLCTNDIPRPDGSPRCDAQRIKLKSLNLGPKKGQIKAGKKRTLVINLSSTAGVAGEATIRLRSSNRNVKVLRNSIPVEFVPSKSSKLKVVVLANRKARGKAVITATSGKLTSKATLTVKPDCKKSKSDKLCGKTNHL